MRPLSWFWKSSLTYSKQPASFLASLLPARPLQWAARVLVVYAVVGLGGTAAAYVALSIHPRLLTPPRIRPAVSEPLHPLPGQLLPLKGEEFDTDKLIATWGDAPIIGQPVVGENGEKIGKIFEVLHMTGGEKSYVVIAIARHGTEDARTANTITVPDDILRLVGKPPSGQHVLLAGLSTTALFDLPEHAVCSDQPAQWLSSCRSRLQIAESGTPADNDKARNVPVTINGNDNVVSFGQSGGITAGTYIDQAKAELKLLGQKDQDNPDGSHTAVFAVGIEAPFTPGKLSIEVHADGLVGVSILPPAVGGIVTMQKYNVRQTSNSYSTDIPAPSKQYEISVQTKCPSGNILNRWSHL
jgi:rRNA processing protein Gar1